MIEIIKIFPQHQYFIITYSPAIIGATEPSTIVQKAHDMYSLLNEIGVQLSDIVGANRLLWVGGETEEKYFPLILTKIAQEKLR
ncbi:hypothetical protein [Trichormus azollae]|uniref:hypothetical protein n=1 Tax=Trichormus azollae TaxID=1164 RepID=UPI00325DDFF7